MLKKNVFKQPFPLILFLITMLSIIQSSKNSNHLRFLSPDTPKTKHFGPCTNEDDCEKGFYCYLNRCMTQFEIRNRKSLGFIPDRNEMCNNENPCEKNYQCTINRCEKITNSKSETNKGEEKETSITLIMTGDMLMHDEVHESGLINEGNNKTYNFDHIFTHVKDDIQKADLKIVNQETIIGGTELGIIGRNFVFNSPYELGDSLIKAGFNLILHANNHALDKWKKGIENALKFWKKKYPKIPVLGISLNKKDYENNYYIYEKNGLKIGIINYTTFTNKYYSGKSNNFLVNYLKIENINSIKNTIEKVRKKCDFLIVCVHWGKEYKLFPHYSQVRWARFFANNNVDLVLGTHPHVIEPISYVQGNNGKLTLVYFSLGNFISHQTIRNTYEGALASVTITKKGENVFVSDHRVIPVITHQVFGSTNYTTYKLEDYSEDLAKKNRLYKLKSPNFSYIKALQLCQNVFEGFCKV